MIFAYPAIYYPEEDGRYSVIIPDLNNLSTYGNNLLDALAMSKEACGQYLFTSLKDGEKFPEPTPCDVLKKDNENAFIDMVYVNLPGADNVDTAEEIEHDEMLSVPSKDELNRILDKYIKKGDNYVKLYQMLQDVYDSYLDFVVGTMHYAMETEEHCKELIEYIENYPKLSSSDILEFVVTREDYFDYAEPIGDMNRERLLELLSNIKEAESSEMTK